MEFRSVLAFLLEEINEGTNRHIYVTLFPELTQTVTQWMNIAADCCLHGDSVNVMLSVLLYRIFTVQTVQSATELYLQ
jgi:hypothetical protein